MRVLSDADFEMLAFREVCASIGGQDPDSDEFLSTYVLPGGELLRVALGDDMAAIAGCAIITPQAGR